MQVGQKIRIPGAFQLIDKGFDLSEDGVQLFMPGDCNSLILAVWCNKELTVTLIDNGVLRLQDEQGRVSWIREIYLQSPRTVLTLIQGGKEEQESLGVRICRRNLTQSKVREARIGKDRERINSRTKRLYDLT